MELSRRKFIQTAAATGALTAVMGLSACSSKQRGAEASGDDKETIKISETKSADIVVVGGGMSGLAATVSASSSGNSVVVLEASGVTGGNGVGTEGIFACGSSIQKAKGIEFTFAGVVTKELEFFNYRIDSLAWKDMVESSADNLDWLLSNGVLIDHVDNYRGMGEFECFHWWGGYVENGYISSGGAQNGYINPMTDKAVAQGAEILYNTRCMKLIMENGAVAGVVAQRADKSWLQIDCKAVIIATGGYIDNDEKVREIGIDPSTITRMGLPHHEGDGLDMIVSAGGVDSRSKHCLMREPGVEGYPFGNTLGALGVRLGGPYMFVNGDGERFTNENCTKKNQAYMANCVASQPASFAIVNQAVLEDINNTQSPGIIDEAKSAIDQNAQAFTADTLADLAVAIGANPETLAASMKRYNTFCAKGVDEDFSKESGMLKAMEKGPFWAFQMGLFCYTSLGGIAVNRKFEVIDANRQSIPGLWAAGVDACELYRETYTVMVPASCMGNNINSGRHAGLHAIEYCKA